MSGPRTLRNAVLIAGALVLAFGLALPFVRMDRFRIPISTALEKALEREVEIDGPVRFRLFPWPGFAADGVVIREDPAWGLEPIAYVSTLEGDVSLPGLVRGRLALSSLRLVRPSVNLAKNRQGQWNYPVLLERAFGAGESGGRWLPRIEVRSGRLNFKFDNVKSVLYFTNADVDVSPLPETGRTVQVRFAGEPARTDRPAHGFGRLTGNGHVEDPEDGEKRVELVLRLERTAITDVLTLLGGRGAGLGGFVTSRAELSGPVSALRVTGNLNLVHVDQRFLLPGPARDWTLDYSGELNLPDQRLTLESRAPPRQALPVTVRLRLWDYLTQPQWAFSVTADKLRLDTLPALAHEIGLGVPPELAVSGAAIGAVTWTRSRELQGSFTLQDFAMTRGSDARIQADEVLLRVAGDKWQVEPTAVRLPGGGQAEVAVDYDSADGDIEIRMRIETTSIPTFRSLWESLIRAEAPPLLLLCTSGSAGGRLRFRASGAGEAVWTGRMTLSRARLPVAGIAKELDISQASVLLDGAGFRIESLKGRVGEVGVSGDYRMEAAAERPNQFRLAAPAATLAELEALLAPTLYRQRGFLARTLRLRPAPLPAWLRARRAEGELRIGRLQAGGLEFDSIKARLYWDGAIIELPRVEARLQGATLSGRLQIDLMRPAPQYRAQGRIRGLAWAEGRLNAEGRVKTSGTGADLLLNLSAEGEFRGHAVRLAPNSAPAQINGCYELAFAGGESLLRITCLELVHGGRTYWGFGEASLAGKLEADLYNSSGEYRLEGTLVPLNIRLQGPIRAKLE